MNDLVFNIAKLKRECGPQGRVIIVAFARAVGIMLSRILEVSAEQDFSGVYIVALPFGDEVSRAGGADNRVAARAARGTEVCPRLL
jgi:hypothetical protein